MKSKAILIQEFLSQPVKVGDSVTVRGLGSQNKVAMGQSTKVVALGKKGSVFIEEHGTKHEIPKEDYERVTSHIGCDPFIAKPWNSRLRMISYNLASVLAPIFDKRKKVFNKEVIDGIDVPELNWNPTIVDSDGNDVVYQRDFCWTLKDKQLLIDSIYNSIDIGKIVVRNRSYKWVENRIKNGKSAAFKDVVDGKQRLNAIIGFICGEFPDSNGFYWDDLSSMAHLTFYSFSALAYGEVEEDATDADIKAIFLGVNFTGVQMSQEHIDFVKGINL